MSVKTGIAQSTKIFCFFVSRPKIVSGFDTKRVKEGAAYAAFRAPKIDLIPARKSLIR